MLFRSNGQGSELRNEANRHIKKIKKKSIRMPSVYENMVMFCSLKLILTNRTGLTGAAFHPQEGEIANDQPEDSK